MKQRKPAAWWDEEDAWPVEQPRLEVIEDAEEDRWSGLYDAKGRKLMRQRQPIGFRPR